jgi:hypothetical protein
VPALLTRRAVPQIAALASAATVSASAADVASVPDAGTLPDAPEAVASARTNNASGDADDATRVSALLAHVPPPSECRRRVLRPRVLPIDVDADDEVRDLRARRNYRC